MTEAPTGVCDVCFLLDGDDSWKPVKYCSLCDSFLCDDCRGRYDLRAIAAVKRVGRKALEMVR